ncbi:MAG: SurA N-terminal domain-containing protein [Tannerella sp.]|jgi:peptidyl-prolyl cis-trans isomerase D|nr:SurA N-terminal domain-containing protein [Tannerella sp.]
MAALEKIRSWAGFLVIVIGLALFAFIIGDFLNSGSTYLRQSKEDILNVNGKSVHYLEYQKRVDEMTEVYKMQMNTNQPTEEQFTQIRQSSYDAIVNEIVLNGALDKVGITVTSEELFDMVQGENISPLAQQFPLFRDPQTGAFDKMRALNVLKTIENYDSENTDPQYQTEMQRYRTLWLFWERNMKMQAMQNKFSTLLTKVVVSNQLEAKDAYESGLENSDIIYTMQSFASVPDSTVKVSDSEISKLYNERKEQFKQKENRIIDFIVVDIRPSQDDYDQTLADVQKVYEELKTTTNVEEVVNASSEAPFMNAYVAESGLDTDMKAFVDTAVVGSITEPLFREDSYRIFKLMDKKLSADSVNVKHILIASQTATKAQMETVADSLLNVIKGGGNFEEIAAQYSADQQSGQAGGEIGWLTELYALRYFGEEFKDAIFSATLNQPVVLSTNYGVHIIKVTEKTANVPKYKLAYVHVSVTPSSKTYSNLYNRLNQFISTNNTIAKIDTAATAAGYVLTSNVSINATDRGVGIVPDSRQVVRWAFEGNKNDEISSIFECKNHFIVAARKGKIAEGYQSVQAVTPILRSQLMSELKGREIAQTLKAKNLSSVLQYAEAIGSQVDTVRFVNFATPRLAGIGVEPKLNAAVAYSPLQQVSTPVAGNNGVYVFTVIDRSKSEVPYDEKEEILKLESVNSYRASFSSFESLMNNAKIIDNRIRFE